MSYQWTAGSRRFQADVDDMLQDFRAEDVGRLAIKVREGAIVFDDSLFACSVALELERRAAAGLLFRPMGAASATVATSDPLGRAPW